MFSTIFKTVQDLTTGKTKITPSGFLGGMFGGDFFKAQSIVSEEDIKALEAYNESLGNTKPAEAFDKTMKNASTTAQNLAKNAKGAAVDINAIPKASKAAAAGMKALSVAGNMLVSMGIAFAITKIIEGIQWLATSSERAREAAEELANELNTQKDTIDDNISTVKGLEDEFTRLSKGVDDYGANISLSADEYERYQQIVQQIVGISPSLISGYDKEGNAIANKNGLIEQSIELLKEENRQRVANATSEESIKTLGKGKIEEYKDAEKLYYDNGGVRDLELDIASRVADASYYSRTSEDDIVKMMSEIGGGILDTFNNTSGTIDERVETAIAHNAEQLTQNYDKYRGILEKYLVHDDLSFIDDTMKTYSTKYSLYMSKMESAAKALNPTLQTIPQSLTVYDELSDKQKAFISEYINTFKITSDTTEKDIENMRQNILEFTQAVGNATPETKKSIEDLFSLDKTKIPAAEWEKQVNDLINQIVGALNFDSEEDKNKFIKQLKIRVGIEFTTDGETTVDTMISNLQDKFKGKFKDEIAKLDIDDLKILSNLDISPEGIEDWSQVEFLINAARVEAEGISGLLQGVTQELSSLQSRYKELKAAQDEYNSTGAISAETMQKLISNGLLQYLDYSSGKLKINTAALLAEGEAAKINAIQKLQDAAATDLMILAGTKTGEMSNTAKTAIENMGNAAEKTGSQAETAAGKLLNFAAGAWAAAGLDPSAQTEEVTAKANAILSAYQNIANTIGGLTIKDPKTKSGSSKNEALDNYLKDAENRYKIHQDETKYIQELQYAHDNLTKNEKERLDITGKINEAYRDLADNRIKDIEHQIDLVKELNELADVTDYYEQIQKISHEEANRLRAMGYDNNSNEIQDLQKKWWDAQKSIVDWDWNNSNDWIDKRNEKGDWALYGDSEYEAWQRVVKWLREKYPNEVEKIHEATQKAIDARWDNSNNWIDERNTYNDWELFGDSEVDAWERVIKWLKEDYPDELGKIKEAEEKLFEARKDAMEKSIDDIEDYIDARNTYNDWETYGDSEVKAIQRQTKIIEDMYKQRLLSYEEYVDKLEEQTKRIYSLGQDRVDKHLSDIDKYIDARNFYNDWDDFGDSEINAIEKQLKVLKNAYRLNLISYEDYTERFAEYTQKLYSAAKDNIIEEVSKLIEDYEEMKNLESSQLESQKTLLQSYYDVTNSIAEAQHEINKELSASMTMYEYLNEETRALLFNQEDYNLLNEELLEIQSAADALQKQYQEDILNANAETIAEITSQYQMQYETMMKQYEIAKAELEIAKKRQKLDNVLAERNTRMFINGQWQWVAKTQDVINAQNELAEAEIERKKQEASLEQTEAINEFTAQINALETDLNKVRKWWSDIQEMLDGEADDVAKALEEISQVASPELKRVIETTGGSITSFSDMLSESTEAMSDIIDGDRGFGTMADSISTIITDLGNYSDAIKALVKKLNGIDVNKDEDSQMSTSDIIKEMKANSAAWHSASESEKKALEDRNQYLGDLIGAKYDSATGTWTYPTTSSSGGSSSGSSGGKTVQVGSDGNAPSGTKVGDVVNTAGGSYLVVPKDTPGSTYNPASGLSSIKIKEKDADGTRYTSGGLTLMGEEGFEAFISNTGRLIPISQPTIGNIGAGGIVFNREQMAGLRTLWDWSNLGKISPSISSSGANSQSTVIDNSIHINGLTVSEQGNEDWINGFRRYVATHK